MLERTLDESDPSRQYRSNLDLPDSANTVVCIQHFPDGFGIVSVKGKTPTVDFFQFAQKFSSNTSALSKSNM